MNENYTLETAAELADEITDKTLTVGAAADLAGSTLGLDYWTTWALARWAWDLAHPQKTLTA